MTPPLLTKSEAASRARISPRSLDNRIREGSGPIITRIGSKTMVREDHLADWLERCAGAPAPERKSGRKRKPPATGQADAAG